MAYFNIKSLGEFMAMHVLLKKEQRKLLCSYQNWFKTALPMWFDSLQMECIGKITKAIEFNQSIPDEKYTTSATDTFDILYCFVVEWRLLEWTLDAETFVQMIFKVRRSFDVLNSVQKSKNGMQEITNPIDKRSKSYGIQNRRLTNFLLSHEP